MSFYRTDGGMEQAGRKLVADALQALAPKGLEAEHFSLTWLVHDRPLTDGDAAEEAPRGFGYRAAQPYYPCSVVKLFYLVAAQQRLKEGFIQPHGELDRAMRDMIQVSSNTATNYVIDLVTGTTGDTLLPEAEMAAWVERRGWVNRHFAAYGWPELAGINLCQKLMDDQRYGRERLFAGADGRNHNRLTSDAAVRLFHALLTGQILDPARCAYVRDQLSRSLDPAAAAEPGAQVLGYLGEGLPSGARLWSKAGWTTWTGDPTASYRRHDAAYVELPSGRAFTLAVFTEGKAISADMTSLPTFARLAVALTDGGA